MARDIGGADPERMTPLRTAEYLRAQFAGSAVSVRVLDDRAVLEREYPLLAAVDRAAASVERHRGTITSIILIQSFKSNVFNSDRGPALFEVLNLKHKT